MSTTNIDGLPVAVSLTGAESLPLVQGGTTKRAQVGLITGFGAGTTTQSANTVYAGPTSGAASVPTFRAVVNADIAPAGAALTKTDDTNVTLTLGGTPTLALLNAVALTLGWTGQLSVARGGTNASSASIAAFNNITGYTAAGATGTTSTNLVFSTSPTLVTPTLGAATATSINKVAITAPASSATLTIADGKTATISNTLTFAGTDSTVMTFPTTSATIARTDAANTFTGNQTISAGQLQPATGTASIAPVVYTAGTNLTSAVAGASEFDGVQFYRTIDTTSGRGAVPVEQYFHLTSAGSTISTIANYFGTASNISLVASAYYVIDIYAWFLNTTSGTVVWTLTNSAAPTAQNVYYEMSPITGVVAPPGTATMLVGQIRNDASAALALSATGNLTDAVSHYMHMKIFLQNGTGTSLKIQATKSAGTITPGINSYWIARRISPNNIGTFAA